MGAINAAKLAEGEDPANPGQGLAGLEALWSSLQRNEDMYLEEDWLHDPEMDSRVRDALTGRAAGLDIVGPQTSFPSWGDLAFLPRAVVGLSFLMTDGQALLKSLGVFGRRARVLFNLKPIYARLGTDLDPAKVAAWASTGNHRLRLGMVGLESGRMRYATETGAIIERDGSPVLDRSDIPAACRPARNTVERLEDDVRRLQEDLSSAATGQKPRLWPGFERCRCF